MKQEDPTARSESPGFSRGKKVNVRIIQGDARRLPLADASVDLIITSPPYWSLRSYTDGCPECAAKARKGNRGYMQRYCPQCSKVYDSGRNQCSRCGVTTLRTEATKAADRGPCQTCGGTGSAHYDGQIGSEPTPQEYIGNLIDCTREWMRVLKPTGSIFVNLGDKYGSDKGRLYLPERYRIACTDRLGLIGRAVIIWSKINGLPESVTDRVRASHEDWVHLTLQPRYYSAIDHIRQQHSENTHSRRKDGALTGKQSQLWCGSQPVNAGQRGLGGSASNSLGALPGSVWEIPTEPLQVPAHLGIDHYAAYPMEWPRRIILGWSPAGICTTCGEGRRPVSTSRIVGDRGGRMVNIASGNIGVLGKERQYEITGEVCGCPDTSASTRPAVVLDPFSGTGTTALVAHALGRDGIGVDMSADYCRLAEWRTQDPGQLAKAMGVPKPPKELDGQASALDLLTELDGGAA